MEEHRDKADDPVEGKNGQPDHQFLNELELVLDKTSLKKIEALKGETLS